jgi:predicted AAA+ superfamily ATPase
LCRLPANIISNIILAEGKIELYECLYKRHAEEVLKKAVKTFSAVLATGARQTGKTTLSGDNRVIPVSYL